MPEGSLGREHAPRGKVRGVKIQVNKVFRSLNSIEMKRYPRILRVGAVVSKQAIGLVASSLIILFLLFGAPPLSAGKIDVWSKSWPDKQGSKKKDTVELQGVAKLELYGPEHDPPVGGKGSYRLRIGFPPVIDPNLPVKVDKQLTPRDGRGLLLELSKSGFITLGVEDDQAYFLGRGSLYYKETDRYGKKQDGAYTGDKKYGSRYEVKPPPEPIFDLGLTVKEEKAAMDFLMGFFAGQFYSAVQLLQAFAGPPEKKWGLTTGVPRGSSQNPKGFYHEGDQAHTGRDPNFLFQLDQKYDYYTIAWKQLSDAWYSEYGTWGYEINYLFEIGRERPGETELLVRVVFPYTRIDPGFGKTIDRVRKYVELEWIIKPLWKEELKPPSAPASLTGTPACFRRVDLTWKDESTNEEGFYVDRKTGTDYTRVASLPADTTSYTDTGLEPETTYWYRVTAYNEAGKSSSSSEVNVTTPPVPAQAKLTLGSAFDDGDGDVSSYRVHVELNGHLIYSGCPGVGTSPIEHGRRGKKADSGFQNLKNLEILFDRKLLGGGNRLEVTLTGVDRKHTFCWESLAVDCIELPYEHYRHRARIHDTTYRSFVHGGETYWSRFTLPQK